MRDDFQFTARSTRHAFGRGDRRGAVVERLVGLLGLHCLRNEKHWSPHEITWLGVVADLFTSALRRMRSDVALRESEERFRALAEHAKDPICEFSDDGKFLYASPSFTELLGYTREDLAQMNFSEFVHPDDQAALSQTYANSEPGEFAGALTYRARHRSGEWVAIEATARMFASAGGARRVVAVLRDVTERQRSQAALRHQLDLETRIAELSRRFLALPADAVDREIQRSLGDLAAVAGADHIWMLAFGNRAQPLANAFEWCAPGVEPQPQIFDPQRQTSFTWAFELLARGGGAARRGLPPGSGGRTRRFRATRCGLVAVHRTPFGTAHRRVSHV